ncbi:MAG TPA: putative lipid II flippase FtsW [Candidatus Acidoferrales bacterium]|nr:putative lipid II flippase FtsW [Candidatus Acidoferrales bacterium]
MPRGMRPDRWLFLCTLGLCVMGAVMVFSASSVTALTQTGSAYGLFLRQMAALVTGLCGMAALSRMDYRLLRRPPVVITSLGVVLVLLLAVLLLDRAHATHRWMRLGPASLQPSEFAKLAAILFLAWFLEPRVKPGGGGVNRVWETLVPALAPVVVLAALVVVEPDLGTSLMIVLVAGAMVFEAGLSLRLLAGAVAAALPVVYLLIARVPYRLNRFMAFLHPAQDPQGAGFQLLQSLIAVGSGGFFGVGLMASRQKLFYLPEAPTDFIFAVLSEELGFIGAAAVVVLFGIYGWRGLRAALAAPDDFGRMLAMGITFLVVGQALVNLSVVVGLLPTKGIPLPFISYGGSSLVVMLLATGILLNISQYAD